MLKVLFVCSGPTMYKSHHFHSYKSLDDMKSSLPSDIYNYLYNNNLIKVMDGRPTFWRRYLPPEYIKRLMKPNISSRDLDLYREYTIKVLKMIYPDLNHISYVSVDPITLDPYVYGDDKIMSIMEDNDKRYTEKYGVTMKFQGHYTGDFQEFLKHNTEIFDVIWFMQCTKFDWVIDMKPEYIENIQKSLDINGYLIHMDYTGIKGTDPRGKPNQPLGALMPIDERFDKIKTKKSWSKVRWFLDHLIQVKPGIYIFKDREQYRKELAMSLIL